ncbi:MAG TPA: hypothetical protein VES67_06930 [Vicinamibacterales bacterium]|nr:hypothetical protein [Vicinamibacterales bacterium]
MFQLTASPGVSRRVLNRLGVALMVAGGVVILRDPVGAGVFFLTFAGMLGGLLLLTVIRRLNRAPDDSASDAFLRDGLSTDVINFSRIRVTGVGGLALVAVAVAIAFSLPFVGVSLALGLVGGILLSFALLGYRRQHAGRWP